MLCHCEHLEKSKEEDNPEEKVMTTYRNDMLAYAKKLAYPKGTAKSKWEYKTGTPLAAYKTACKKYMGKSTKVEYSDCGNFISTVARAKGPNSKAKFLAGANDSFPKVDGFKVVWKGKKIPDSEITPGRIVRYKKTNGKQHTLILISKGVVCEAGRSIRFPVIHKSTKYNSSSVKLKTLEVLEPIEKEVKN